MGDHEHIRKNMRIKLFEDFKPQMLNFEIGPGNIFGIIHKERRNFENWLIKENVDDEVLGFFAMFPDDKLLPIAILKNMNVEESERGKGLGGKLMSRFMNSASDAKNVVLIADLGESNTFDLEKWYQGWGFSTIGHAGKNPVMILNNY